MPQRIVSVKHGSLAEKNGIRPGEILLSIDRMPILDFVDYQYLVVRQSPELLIEDEDGNQRTIRVRKPSGAPLGLTLESSLMSCPKTCANHCIFCFIEQMPPGMRPSLYVRDDDWRLSLMTGNFVTLTNLPDQELERIIARHASPLYISVHTTNGELRKQMLRHIHADRIMDHLRRFADHGINFHCQIVLCPGINDGDELKKTLEDLASLIPHALTVALVPVGLTRYRRELYPLRPYTHDEADRVVAMASAFQKEMLKRHGTRFVFPSDEFYQIAGIPIPDTDSYEDFPQIENGVGLLARFRQEFEDEASINPDDSCAVSRHVVMATGTSVAPFMRALVDSHPIAGVRIDVHPIVNHFFGETVTVSGLITGQDLVAQMSGVPADEILITESMLREGDRVFLDDMTLQEAKQALGVPIIPVPNDGGALLQALRGTEES